MLVSLALSPLDLPGWAQGLFLLILGFVTAYYGYKGNRVRADREQESSTVEARVQELDVLIKSQGERIKSQGERMDQLEAQLRAVREDNRELEITNRRLLSDLHTKEELVESAFQYLDALESWDAGGRTGPRPSHTWQMKYHLERRNSNNAT